MRFALAFVLLLACATAQAGDRGLVAPEGTLGAHWQLPAGASLATAAYPPQFADRGADACVALGYRIAADGATSDFEVLSQWNSEGGEQEPEPGFWRAFAEAGAEAVAQWRFEPRPGAGDPRQTYTVATLAFTAAPSADAREVRAHCAIGDLAARLRELDDAGRKALARKDALDEARRNGAFLRREQVYAPESSTEIGSSRPVHRW